MPITSPKYSFIQFNQPEGQGCCNGITDISLPVVNSTDLYFQILSDTAPGALSVVNSVGDVLSSQSGFVEIMDGVYGWQSPIDLSGVDCDACFQLKIGTALSNVFKKRCDDCFTTLLEYYNDEDYADFIYCNSNFINRVRLPLFLSKPKMSEERAVYRKSNGVIKLTKSILTKEYQVQTDFMPEPMHDALSVALAHDNTNVYSKTYTGSISKSSEYNEPWDDDMCVAQADFKVAVAPLAIRNNNCQECAEIIPPTPCVPVALAAFSFDHATIDIAYSKTLTVTGDAPFTYSNVVAPGWMTVSVSGASITFSGTPHSGDVGEGIPVSFDVANACGNISIDKTIDVAETTCIPVGIVGTPSLPNAQVGVFYSYSFGLSGDPNFTFGAITAPAWMDIGINNSTKMVTVSGTPPSAVADEEVSIEITNCGAANSIVFGDTITVVFTDVEIGGTISSSGKSVTVNIDSAIPCDVTFGLLGTYDDGGTPTEFSAMVTVLAGNISGSLFNAAPFPITCMKPNELPNLFVYSQNCSGTNYNFSLTINDPC